MRMILSAIASATLVLASVSVLAQPIPYDRNASNNPEIYQQTHPEDPRGRNFNRNVEEGQDRNLGRRDRDAARRDFDRREAQRHAAQRHEAQRLERERRLAERREWERREWERRHGRRDFDGRDFGRRDFERERYYYGARGPEFRRGGYIPREYRNRQYYVNDWRSHRLAPPPHGHQWVQVGSDYVLIAVATGLIANLILSQ